MKEITLRDLKERVNNISESDLDKTIDEVYIEDSKKLDKLFGDSPFYIKASWDYDD